LNQRLKTLVLCNLSLLGLLSGIALGIRQPILQRFADLEKDLMRQQLVRVANALTQRMEKLDSSVKAEAAWESMYAYLDNPRSTFYSQTYTFAGLSTAQVDVFGVFDRAGKPLHLDLVDGQLRRLRLLPNPMRGDLLRDKLLYQFLADTDPNLSRSRVFAGVPTGDQLLLVVSRPILTGEAKGPRRGSILMGIWFNDAFLTQMNEQGSLKLELERLSSYNRPASDSVAGSAGPNSASPNRTMEALAISPEIWVDERQQVTGAIYLLDSAHQPVRWLKVQAPRREYQQGKQTLNHLTAVLYLVGLPLGLIISLLLDRSMRYQQLLQASESALQSANQELQQLANLDSLTQVANRRGFEQAFRQEWSRALRERQPLTLIICDVDYFKRFNDTYGHPAGDVCLQRVAEALQRSVRRSVDLVARYGGEEFTILLPNTDAAGGVTVARLVQAEMTRQRIAHAASPIASVVTLSFGLASVVPDQTTAMVSLLERSDQQLYRAKQQGRNRIAAA
jgi:diguanylate cyclase (GGDEF)-like protein